MNRFKRRIKVLLYILGMLVFSLVACADRQQRTPQEVSNNNQYASTVNQDINHENQNKKDLINKEQRGNTVGNIINEGKAAEDGKSIYYTNGYTLYQKDKQTEEEVLLLNESVKDINVLPGSLIVVGEKGIYAIDLGTGLCATLQEGWFEDVSVVEEWIYYINREDGRKIYRMKLDGTEQEVLCDQASARLNVVDQTLYYCEVNLQAEEYGNFYSPCGKLYCMDIKEKKGKRLTEQNVSFVNVQGEWIYYSDVDDGMKLYKMKRDGTDCIKLWDQPTYFINGSDESYLYFTDISSSIYAMELSSGQVGRLAIDKARYTHINVVDHRLFYDAEGLEEANGFIELEKCEIEEIKDNMPKDLIKKDFTVSDGQNSITLGMLYDEMIVTQPEILVENNLLTTEVECELYYKYYKNYFGDFNIISSNRNDKKEYDIDTYYVVGISLLTDKYKTNRGIHVGSSKEDVVQTYGEGNYFISEAGIASYQYLLGEKMIEIYYDESDCTKGISLQMKPMEEWRN